MCTLCHCLIGNHGNQADLAILVGNQDHHAAGELLLQLVAQAAQLVHVNTRNMRPKERNSLDFLHIVHDISKGGLCLLGLHGLVLGLHFPKLLLERADSLRKGCRSCLDKVCRLIQLFLDSLIVLPDIVARQRLNSADTGCNAVLGKDLEGSDLNGVGHMRSAAELHGPVAHFHDAHAVAVFLAEERHGAGLLGVLQRHHFRHNRKALCDLLIDKILDLLQLLAGHCLEMREVKAGPVCVLIGAGLLDVGSENLTEGLLQKVRCRVIAAGCHAVLLIHLQGYLVAQLEHTGNHMSDVSDLAACNVLRGLYGKDNRSLSKRCLLRHFLGGCLDAARLGVGGGKNDQALVTDLAAHGPVERRLLRDDCAVLSVGKSRCHAVLFLGLACACRFLCRGAALLRRKRRKRRHRDNLRLRRQLVVSDKSRGHGRIHFLINRCRSSHVGCRLAGALAVRTCLVSLLLHRGVEAVLIHGKALLLQDFLRVVEREAVGVVELERILAGELLFSRLFQRAFHLSQNFHSLLIGLLEFLFLGADHVQDEVSLLLQFRVAVLRGLDDILRQRRKERSLNAELASVPHCAADDPAEDISSSVVGRHDAVRNHEGHCAGVIRADTDGDIRVIGARLLIFHTACQSADQIAEGLERIHVEDGSHILHRNRQTLQTHSGIDVLLDQIAVIAVAVIVELGKYDIPDLHEAVAFAAHDILRSVSVLLAAVIVNLGAGAAGAGAVLPEIVLLAELVDVIRRDMHVVQPDVVGLLVIHIHGRIQTVRVQTDALRQEFPCPRNRFLLEIIAEGEISQHFKIGAVTRRLSDILQIAGADALLARGHPSSRRDLLTGKPGLHRRHAGIDDQERCIVVRNQRKAVQSQTPLLFKEGEEQLTQFIDSSVLHSCISFPEKTS